MRILTPWTSQPQIATEIDWSNPLVIEGGIFAVVNGATGQLYRRNKTEQLVPIGSASRATTTSGVALYGAGTSDGWVTPSNFDDLNGLAALSGYIKGKSPNAGVLVARWGTAPSYGGHLVAWDSGEIFALVAETSTTANWFAKRTSGASSGIVRFGFSFSNNAVRPFLSGDPSVGSNLFSGSVGAIQSVGYPLYICRHGDSNSGAGNTYVELVIYGNKPWSDALHKNIDSNPWQIFKAIPRRIFVPVSVSGDATGTGSLYAITLSSPEGAASGTGASNGTGTGSLASSSLTSPTGSAAGTANATATGSLATSTLTAPTGSASAGTSATANGAFAASSLSAPSATATGSALATGALTTVTLTTITASATGSALATGSIDQIDLSTISGSATGTTAGNATGVGAVATIALSAPVATALGTALATGNFASIGLGTVSGSASAATDGQAAASIQPISISAPLAIAVASSVATGGIQSIGLTAPTGTASGQTQTIARPTSDISNTGWTPSTGSDLYAMLDEETPSDADYISTSSVGAVCKFGMNATAFPGSASQHLSLRASSSTGNGLTVVIKDGATVIATRSLTLTPTFDLHTITLTSGEIAAITSGNLTVEMTST